MFDSRNKTEIILVDCKILISLGVYCFLLFILSIITNTILIWLLVKYKKDLMQQINSLILALAILALIGTMIGLPTVLITLFQCKFVLIQ